ncbi:MAG TPA: HNH endonuclease signature motif containing protein [Thermoanaerobaculia bacterium]|nr:HNH endonuclease signature motif containing protein [Thermoanaerobaculia bacterium]
MITTNNERQAPVRARDPDCRSMEQVMTKTRIPVPEATRLQIIFRCNNRCPVCQTPFIVIHHVDEDPSNNEDDNLAPLCPNCHTQAHATSAMTLSLTPSRIKALRDKWYTYCEARKDSLAASANAVLNVHNFVRAVGFAQHGWSKTFSVLDPAYKELSRDEIINRVFATSNRDDLVTYLTTMKYMYQVSPDRQDLFERFSRVCHAFGIDYAELE